MGLPQAGASSSNRSGSAILDSAPPSPNERIFSKPVPPGSDTRSLLGGDEANEESNPALSTPGNRLMLFQSMVMQAVNGFESIAPGYVPEFVKAWVAQGMEQVPMMAEQMARQGSPGAMLSSVGSSIGTGPQPGPPMGAPAMGLGGGGMGRPMPPVQ